MATAEQAQKGPALPICFRMTSPSSLTLPLLWFPFQTASYLAVNMLSSTAFLLYSLASLVASSPLAAEHYHNQSTTPSQYYPNGTANPFYPCGATATEVAACPYRCYKSTGELLPSCFTQSSATAAINALQNICVKCEIPDQIEDYVGGCEPLTQYFNGLRPSRCGFEKHRLRECAWDCAAGQTPFSICDAQNTTGSFRLCQKCKPQCSSPRIVFQPSYLPSNFSIAAGSCSTQYGPQQNVACPYRCKDAGNPNTFCSLNNRTDNLGFTSCEKCA